MIADKRYRKIRNGFDIINQAKKLGRFSEISKMNYRELMAWAKENDIKSGVIKK